MCSTILYLCWNFLVSGSEGCGLSSGDDLSLRHLAPSKREEITSIEFLPDTIPVNKSTQERVFMNSHCFYVIFNWFIRFYNHFWVKMRIFGRKPSKETLTKLHERKFILHSQALNNLRKEISLIDDRNTVFNHFSTKMTSLGLKWP